jgi:hypothetical protein
MTTSRGKLVKFSQNVTQLHSDLQKTFYIYDNNLQDHYKKVINLNNYYKYFNELIEVLKTYRKDNEGTEKYRTLNLSS